MKVETKYEPGEHVYRWDVDRQLFKRDKIQEVLMTAQLNALYTYVPKVQYRFESDYRLYSELEVYKTKEEALESINFSE